VAFGIKGLIYHSTYFSSKFSLVLFSPHLIVSHFVFPLYTTQNSQLFWFLINITRNLSTAMASEPQTPAQTIDYNFAREELMLNELSNDPIQTAIARLEKQHEEDKQGTL
jgi:hypothetical protein